MAIMNIPPHRPPPPPLDFGPPQKKFPFSKTDFLDVSDDFKQKKDIFLVDFFLMSGLEMNLTVLPNLGF